MRRALVVTAALNVVLHVLGLILALAGMRPGTSLVSLDERLAYLAGHPAAWAAGWAVWMACALALVAFFAVLAPRADAGPLGSLAVTLAAAGAGVDLLCDTVQIVVLPDLAAFRPPDPAAFYVVERAVGAGGTVVANGLYSIGVLLLALALRRRLPTHVFVFGLGTFAAGMLMVVGGFLGDARVVAGATGPTIAGFLLWTVAVTRSVLRLEGG
jgi:hypothetical protein